MWISKIYQKTIKIAWICHDVDSLSSHSIRLITHQTHTGQKIRRSLSQQTDLIKWFNYQEFNIPILQTWFFCFFFIYNSYKRTVWLLRSAFLIYLQRNLIMRMRILFLDKIFDVHPFYLWEHHKYANANTEIGEEILWRRKKSQWCCCWLYVALSWYKHNYGCCIYWCIAKDM